MWDALVPLTSGERANMVFMDATIDIVEVPSFHIHCDHQTEWVQIALEAQAYCGFILKHWLWA